MRRRRSRRSKTTVEKKRAARAKRRRGRRRQSKMVEQPTSELRVEKLGLPGQAGNFLQLSCMMQSDVYHQVVKLHTSYQWHRQSLTLLRPLCEHHTDSARLEQHGRSRMPANHSVHQGFRALPTANIDRVLEPDCESAHDGRKKREDSD